MGITFKVLSLFVVLLSLSSASRLLYVEKPAGIEISAFVLQLAQSGVDIRGEHDNFVLAVDTNGMAGYTSHVIFENYDSTANTYFVVERANLPTATAVKTADVIFRQYTNVAILDKYVFSVSKDQEDTFVNQIPSYLEVVLVPTVTLPPPAIKMPDYELPSVADPTISYIISQVSSTDLYDFVTYLSGEASSIYTRQAQSTGAIEAQDFLEIKFIEYGFEVSAQRFRSGYSENVIATLRGTKHPHRLVLVTAHYDSRGPSVSSTTQRAPGANDNGSGTGALLQIAKIISDNKLTFDYTVVLMAFSGEEQGLYGSRYAAEQYYHAGTDIIAVLNGDMLAYRSPNESPQLAFTSRSATLSLNTHLANITKTYVNGLAVGTTTGCCTDHSSFYDYGYPATSYFERNGNIADPMYHQSGDLVNREGYDVQLQYPLIVQSMLAGLLTIAHYSVPA